jgi:exodeoxyribonuclease VII small subunit
MTTEQMRSGELGREGSPPRNGDTASVASLTFDRALEELQTTVAQLEAGGQPLEEAIVLYERGVALHEHCARLLAEAELRVKRLVERAGGALEAIAETGSGQDSESR